MKSTPIILNNFNRLTTLRGMIQDLQLRRYENIIVLDNQSTFPPLLSYYNQNPDSVDIRRLDRNYIQNALYDVPGLLSEFKGKYPWIVYSDTDLSFNPKMPDNFIEVLIQLADKYDLQKAGLALRIDDLPDNEWGNKNREWEAKFWLNELEKDVFLGQVDSTFCIVKPTNGMLFESIRVAGDFTCKHLPWYNNWCNLDEEEKYYHDHAHSYSTAKRFYDGLKTN